MRKLASQFLACILALLCQAAWCGAVNYDGNIGFMKIVPKEYKENFPYCDEFLDMKWTESKNSSIVGYGKKPDNLTVWVGRAFVDFYREDQEQKGVITKERKGLISLVGIRPPSKYELTFEQFAYRIPLDEYQQIDWHDPSLKFTIMSRDEDLLEKGYPRTLGLWSEKYRGQENNSGSLPPGQGGWAIPHDPEIKFISERIIGGAFGGEHLYRFQTKFWSGSFKPRFMWPDDLSTFSQYTKNVCLVAPSGQAGWQLEAVRPFYHEETMSHEERRKFALLTQWYAQNKDAMGISEEDNAENLQVIRYATKFDYDGDGVADVVFRLFKTDRSFPQFIYYLNDSAPLIMRLNVRILYNKRAYFTGGEKIRTKEELRDLQRQIAAEKRAYKTN